MDEFAAGTDVFITIPHSNNGTNLTVTDLQYQVLDAQGSVLSDWATAPSFDPSATSTIITILKTYNMVTDKLDIRQLNVNLTTANGTYKQTVYYKLIGDLTNLTPMTDSFMTFAEAILMRIKVSEPMPYYDQLPDDLKCVALENAYKIISKKQFIDPKYLANTNCSGSYFDREYDPYSYGYGYSSTYYNSFSRYPKGIDISGYTLAQFNALPADMILALKKAQLLEANNMAENSPIREKIRLGIISETIGESSMFFKQSGSIGGSKYPGISDDAYMYLKDYLFKNATSSQSIRIGRA